jgi:hypothetical protein
MDDQGAGSGWPAGTDSAGQWRCRLSLATFKLWSGFHNGRSLRVQVNAQARWRNASTRSARRS